MYRCIFWRIFALVATINLFFQIDVLMEDEEFVDSCMGGKPRKAGKFASSLRLSLWSEHLGLHPREVGALFLLEGTKLLNLLLTICAFL